ncbi:MAG: orotate phosphoribosyltransferase [Methanobrevibacter sp.]|jgi:orotate phosphoribosyltransferase|nr:orotate phosphoribosyltransferase [Methanobrevibacter sp.]
MSLKNSLFNLLKEDDKIVKHGKFQLSSGKEADYYIDMKKAITNPKILKTIAILINEKIKDDKIDGVAGPALGAVPIATAVSLESKIPLIMIRKEKKGYGLLKLIEGEIKPGANIVVVEDVTTTGNSLLKAINVVEDNGGIVKRVFSVVDREEGAIDNFKFKDIKLEPLISISSLL